MSALLWLLPLLPAGVGAVLLVRGWRSDPMAGTAAIAVAAAALAGAVWAWAARPAVAVAWLPLGSAEGASLGLSLSAAGEGAPLALLVAAVSLAVFVYADGFLGWAEARARFFGFLALFLGAMLWLVLARDLLTLIIGFELVGLCSYALIGFWYREGVRGVAGMRAFVTTRCGDLGLYLAAMAAFAGGGADALRLDALPGLSGPWAAVAAGGLIAAALGKSAQLPFTGWLSGAMQGPTPVSALLHSATMVAAGVILLIKALPLLSAVSWALPLLLLTGTATVFAGALIALAQDDIKQLLAGSTVSQYGYMVAGIGAAGAAATTSHLVQHAAIKALLFLAAGVLVRQGYHHFAETGGLHRRRPGLAVITGLGVLSLAALPPLGGFFSKEALMADIEKTSLAAFALLTLASVLTAAYAARFWLGLFAGGARLRQEPERRAGDRMMGAALVALAVAAALLGLLVLPPFEPWWTGALGMGALPPPHLRPALLATALVVAGLVLALMLFRRGWPVEAPPPRVQRAYAAAGRWFGLVAMLDEAGRRAVRCGRALDALDRTAPAERAGSAALALARLLGRFDATAMASGLIGGAVRAARGLAEASRLTDRDVWSGAIDRSAAGLQAVAAGLGRLQTGLLHQYYALAWAGILALMLYAFILVSGLSPQGG